MGATKRDAWFWGLLALGAVSLANAAWMLFDPLWWYHDLPAGVPDFGEFNPHFVRDIGCAFVMVGVAQVWAAFSPPYRLPLVGTTAVFLVAHAGLHVYDTARGAVDAHHWWLDMPGVYAHAPHLARTSASIATNVDRRLSLPEPLRILVMAQSAMINGCGFCRDLHEAEAVQAKLGRERFRDLLDFRQSPHFDERERAALAYTEEVTRERKCSDATFQALRRHFDEREIVELTWLNAVGNFYNLIAMPLGLESEGMALLAEERAA